MLYYGDKLSVITWCYICCCVLFQPFEAIGANPFICMLWKTIYMGNANKKFGSFLLMPKRSKAHFWS